MIYFGAMEPCENAQCKNGRYIFNGNTTYRCRGWLTSYGRCTNTTIQPKRRPAEISADIRNKCKFLNRHFDVKDRIIKQHNITSRCTSKIESKKNLKQAPNDNLILPNRRNMIIKGTISKEISTISCNLALHQSNQCFMFYHYQLIIHFIKLI